MVQKYNFFLKTAIISTKKNIQKKNKIIEKFYLPLHWK